MIYDFHLQVEMVNVIQRTISSDSIRQWLCRLPFKSQEVSKGVNHDGHE